MAGANATYSAPLSNETYLIAQLRVNSSLLPASDIDSSPNGIVQRKKE
jgi:hypothetical protein